VTDLIMGESAFRQVATSRSLYVETWTICPLWHFALITASIVTRETAALLRNFAFQSAWGVPYL